MPLRKRTSRNRETEPKSILTPEPKSDQNNKWYRILTGWFVLLLGFLATLATLCYVITGIPTIPDLLSRTVKPAVTSSTTAILPAPTSIFFLKSLVSDIVSIKINNLITPNRFGFNFQQKKIAEDVEAVDLVFSNCEPTEQGGLFCNLAGIDLAEMDYQVLANIEAPEPKGRRIQVDQILQSGQSYVLFAYDGHPIKFRIRNYHFSKKLNENNKPASATLVIEYIYQPNDRHDFQGP